MISIKKLLTLKTDTEQTLMNVVRLLVQGIGLHVVANDPADALRFRNSIDDAYRDLLAEISPAELLVRVGSVVQALEDYASRTTQEQHARCRNYRAWSRC